ncbi:hypothetical protein JI721_08505 [Alicyclobacillus cycloheptanicus]|uniref:PDZ domain-containing protein n=1 Tax=Alicyclobacillus cycloheptanicus TaxID=1457 RepID=A0ABT9XM09_9BACL|nr:hypothetical protein [Alicyclobacillus cycloheptanicus]MDQ0191354.1 hypothetical protein [Alicyclobacillus cycloheptanicus]WDL99836.1 hypothetical protein JI721_08505 [Alicyclobacillus cycloheptanicus]
MYGQSLIHGLLTLLLNPLLYVGGVLMVWERARAANHERRFFGTRVSRVWRPVFALWGQSLAGGVVISAVCLFTGARVTPVDAAVVTAFTLIFGAIRARQLSPLYGIACLLMAVFGIRISGWQGADTPSAGLLSQWISSLAHTDVKSWLAIAAAVCLLEAALLWFNRSQRPAPAYVLGKRGRPVGALLTQWSFLVPMVTFGPGPNPMPHMPGGVWPLLGAVAGGWSLWGLPLLMGTSGFSITTVPSERALGTAKYMLLAGVLLAADVYAVDAFGLGYVWAGIVICLVAREWTVWRTRLRETKGEPLYAQVPMGVRVLGTSQGSVADEMGLLPGEIITQVNQVPVHSNYDLHFAFEQNPAYAKLHVLDARGEMRIVGKPVYTGERNQLGLVLVPDGGSLTCYRKFGYGLFEVLYAKVATREALPVWVDWAEIESAPTTDS